MGIDVVGRRVTLNPEHRNGVDTENPLAHRTTLEGHELLCIFPRNGKPVADKDGNPLIYALKKLNRYSLPDEDRELLFQKAGHVISASLRGRHFDLVVEIPSSSDVVSRTAQMVAASRNPPAELVRCLRKATNREARAMLNVTGYRVQRRDEYEFDRLKERLEALSKSAPGSQFVMKDVPGKFRHIFQPVVCRPDAEVLKGKSVIVVDDLLSSGSSLRAAFTGLRLQGASPICGLVLLGPLVRRS